MITEVNVSKCKNYYCAKVKYADNKWLYSRNLMSLKLKVTIEVTKKHTKIVEEYMENNDKKNPKKVLKKMPELPEIVYLFNIQSYLKQVSKYFPMKLVAKYSGVTNVYLSYLLHGKKICKEPYFTKIIEGIEKMKLDAIELK